MKYMILGLAVMASMNAGAQEAYQVFINLSAVSNDQVPVTINVPKSDEAFSEYHMAKIVPGTYSISDFGRFVSNLKATDQSGGPLHVERLSTNRWKIENGGRLGKIAYTVDDSWDEFGEYGKISEEILFEPGGTNIEPERNVFVLNTFGFIGYLKNLQFSPYKVTVVHPKETFGASALYKEIINGSEDVYTAGNFNYLADGPIMYSPPDTASRKIANANVLVSVFSPNGILSSAEVMGEVQGLMEAQAKFLGGGLPVDRYAYLIYLNDSRTLSGNMGALEHSYSSFFSLPEAGIDGIGQTIRDVAAHEFFHIVTPLNIHSREIGEFNFIDPEMSRHLWLYEGVTEYNSMLVQVKHNLYGLDVFFEEIEKKLRVSEKFPKNISFTTMSKNILDDPYKEMYPNVYYKGALIGMCLDLYLLKHSGGEKNLQWLLGELSGRFGKDKPFEDARLFDIIEELTYPEIRAFLDAHVAGEKPLPIKEALSWAGVGHVPDMEVKEISMGNIRLDISESQQIYIENLDSANEFAAAMGYKTGDIIHKINGEEFTLQSARAILEKFKEESDPGDKVIITVIRENKKGKKKEKKLRAKAIEITKKEKHFLVPMPELTEKQLEFLRAWTMASG